MRYTLYPNIYQKFLYKFISPADRRKRQLLGCLLRAKNIATENLATGDLGEIVTN
jgi:hypothetical protein